MVYRPYEAGGRGIRIATRSIWTKFLAHPGGRHSRSRPRGRRKPKSEFEARRVIHHLDTSPMETGDGSDKAEAEAVAWSAPTLFQPIKTCEKGLAVSEWDSRSITGDRDEGTL